MNLNLVLWTDQSRRLNAIDAPLHDGFGLYRHVLSEYSTVSAPLIARGESANLELKSSFRRDIRENKQNRALEAVVLKTLAGYMNSSGGTLLIGVADDGSIVGLDHDCKTLKKQDRDGFEPALMTAVATKLGGDACHSVQIVFHALANKEVCRTIVAPMRRPVYLKEGDSPRRYVRTGVSTRELNVQEAVNYTAEHWPK